MFSYSTWLLLCRTREAFWWGMYRHWTISLFRDLGTEPLSFSLSLSLILVITCTQWLLGIKIFPSSLKMRLPLRMPHAPLSSFVLQCSEVLISMTQHYNLRGGLCCLAVLVRQDPLSWMHNSVTAASVSPRQSSKVTACCWHGGQAGRLRERGERER